MILFNQCHERQFLRQLHNGDIFERLNNEIDYDYEKNHSSFEEFSKAVEEYIDYYASKRIQTKTKWRPPVQYRLASTCSA